MKASSRKTRSVLLIAALIIIAGVSLAFKFDLIKLNPRYQPGNTATSVTPPPAAGSNETAAETEAAPVSPVSSDTVIESGRSLVAVVQSKEAKAEDIRYDEIKGMVSEAVKMAGGFEGLVKNNMTVVIKPNLVTYTDYTLPGWAGKPLSPEVNGTTTDYRVTRAIVELVRQYDPDGKVYVMEGSAMRTRKCMDKLKYTPEFIPGVDEFVAIEEDSGDWRDFNSPGIVKVPVKNGLLVNEVYMNKKYREADIVISVPALKTHWTEVVSGSVKNVGIGATPATIYGGLEYMQNNRSTGIDHDVAKLGMWLHDWFMARPVDFTIVDGLQGIQNGPTPCYDMTGTTDIKMDQMNTRLIMASRDSVAADSIESLIMEWDPATIDYLGYLEQSGLGNRDVSKIRVVGKQVDEVRKDFKGTVPQGKFTDLTPPDVTVAKSELTADGLSVQMRLSGDTAKVEVYLNGQYIMTDIPKEPDNYTLLIPGISKEFSGKSIVLEVYDKYLSRTEQPIRIIGD